MKARKKIIGLLVLMILTVLCILVISMIFSRYEMRYRGEYIYEDLDEYAKDRARQELLNLAGNISNYILVLETEIDRNMLNAAKVLYEHDRRSRGTLTLEQLEHIREETGMSDLYLADMNGVFTLSTEPEAIGISLIDIWEGYRMLVTGESDYLPSDLKVKAETGEIFKFTAIPRADNRGILESALDAGIVEDYMQRFIDNNVGINSINLFDINLMTLTENHVGGGLPAYTKGVGVSAEKAAVISNFFNGSIETAVNMDKQSAQIYYPVTDGDRTRYVLFIDIDTANYFAVQNMVEEYVTQLVREGTFLNTISLGTVFITLLIFTVVISVITSKLIKKMEEAMNSARVANRAKSGFLAKMSHEIRTPMNAILGIAEIQIRSGRLPADTEEALGKIYESGNLLLGIINDILDLSKIEADKLEILPVKYDILSILNDTVQLNYLRYDSKAIEFTLMLDENTPHELIGDELRIKQILNNLLSNAYKYTEKGEITLSIWAEPLKNGKLSDEKKSADNDNCQFSEDVILVFRVQDTGQGMTEEQVKKLFTEYTRFNLEANRTTVGTGLGLSITKSLVDMMNGEIKVRSKAGEGSVFTVYIPQKRHGSAVCGAGLADRLQDARFRSAAMTKKAQFIVEYMPYGSVLVVDDVESNIYVTKGMLMPYGLHIETAPSGFEAVDKIKSGSTYDVIFMDHMMPKMDGIEATKIIRDLGYTNAIIALTANALVGQAEVFMENGFDGYVSKPIDSRELNSVLNEFIRSKKPPEVVDAARRELKEKAKTGTAAACEDEKRKSELEKYVALDAQKAVIVLDKMSGKIHSLDKAEMESYVVTVHGMKSALANIGEKELSATAYQLEQAGKNGDVDVMAEETPAFIDALKVLIEKLKAQEDAGDVKITGADAAYLYEKLSALKEACASFGANAAREALNSLMQKTWPGKINETLDEISVHLLHSDFEKAAETVDVIRS